MMITPATPSIITDRKSFGIGARERVIKNACRAAVGQTRLLPVVHGGRTLAWIGGRRGSSDVGVIEHKPWMLRDVDDIGRWCGYTSIDNLIQESTQNGKALPISWQKNMYAGGLLTPRWSHMFAVAGDPGDGTFAGTARTAVRHSDADYGALLHGGNVSPDTKHLLSAMVRLGGSATVTECATLLLYDMVISYDQCDYVASLQSMTNTLTAQRYISAGEPGLQIYAVTTGINGNIAYSNIAYTSDTGTAPEGVSAITTSLQSTFTSAAPTDANQWVSALEYSGSVSALDIALRAGDQGVKQIDSYTCGTTAAGAFAFILGYPIAWIPINGSDYPMTLDFVKQIPSVPRIRDGACLTFAAHSVSLGGIFTGGLQVGWG